MSSQDSSDGFTRRGLIRGAAGLGAAGLAAGLVVSSAPAAGAATVPAKQSAATHDPATSQTDTQPVVAHVRDASTGEIDLYVGTRHVQLTDPQLASRLTNAAR